MCWHWTSKNPALNVASETLIKMEFGTLCENFEVLNSIEGTQYFTFYIIQNSTNKFRQDNSKIF